MNALQKNNFQHKSFFMTPGVVFCRFLEILGLVFCLGNRLGTNIFVLENGSLPARARMVTDTFFSSLQHNSRCLKAKSMIYNCWKANYTQTRSLDTPDKQGPADFQTRSCAFLINSKQQSARSPWLPTRRFSIFTATNQKFFDISRFQCISSPWDPLCSQAFPGNLWAYIGCQADTSWCRSGQKGRRKESEGQKERGV